VTPHDLATLNLPQLLRHLVLLQVKIMFLTGDGQMYYARKGRWTVIETRTRDSGRIIYALFGEQHELTLISNGSEAGRALVEGLLGDLAVR
jgi:hypothetical protein